MGHAMPIPAARPDLVYVRRAGFEPVYVRRAGPDPASREPKQGLQSIHMDPGSSLGRQVKV